jgi:hypothetical protein
MTAVAAVETSATSEIKVPMLPFLQGVHERWLREVRSMVDPARQEDAGVWIRWRAIRYLTTSFARRFERERQAVVSLHDHLTGAQAGHLWAAGELLTQLLGRLESRTGLPHLSAEFSGATLNLLTALEYWCQQVDDALGPVRWGEVPSQSRHLFEVITEDDLVEGC